ncbi:MAG: hypothetical protein Kapaf2KO_21380 [Candidatus Kapaibacteriales bacterium]
MLLSISLKAQEFPWYGGARKPYVAPSYFLGLGLGMSNPLSGFDTEYSQEPNNFNSTLDAGINTGFIINLRYLDWYKPASNYYAEVGISFSGLKGEDFISEPVNDEVNWNQRFDYTSNFSNLSCGLGHQLRLIDMLSFDSKVGFFTGLGSTNESKLYSLNGINFANGEDSIELESIENDFSTTWLTLSAGLNYDFPLAIGNYVSVSVMPGINYAFSGEFWLDATLQANYYYGR